MQRNSNECTNDFSTIVERHRNDTPRTYLHLHQEPQTRIEVYQGYV